MRFEYDSLIEFQSTPPMQGATHNMMLCRYGQPVSIHAPYAGSDADQVIHSVAAVLVSIHAPYAGSDLCVFHCGSLLSQFQSTPPMQGATLYHRHKRLNDRFQSTPPMQGATE